MNIDFSAFSKAITFVAMIGVVLGLAINLVAPAHAFYGSLAKDGLPPWECYDHPDHCR